MVYLRSRRQESCGRLRSGAGRDKSGSRRCRRSRLSGSEKGQVGLDLVAVGAGAVLVLDHVPASVSG